MMKCDDRKCDRVLKVIKQTFIWDNFGKRQKTFQGSRSPGQESNPGLLKTNRRIDQSAVTVGKNCFNALKVFFIIRRLLNKRGGSNCGRV